MRPDKIDLEFIAFVAAIAVVGLAVLWLLGGF
jgi:hypothetical protein